MVSIKHIDNWALAVSAVNLLISLFVIDNIVHPADVFPFTEYWSNGGIRMSGICGLVLSAIVTSGLAWLVVKREIRRGLFDVLLCCVVLICLLMWFDLWWGSTFYYGEVRDKQGLGFPWRSLIGLVYVVWRARMPRSFDALRWRWLSTGMVCLLLWGCWVLAYEPWNLWQS